MLRVSQVVAEQWAWGHGVGGSVEGHVFGPRAGLLLLLLFQIELSAGQAYSPMQKSSPSHVRATSGVREARSMVG